MAESTSGDTKPNQPRKELSTETRLLLAFLLMGAVLFLTPYFYRSGAPPPEAKKSPPAGAPATQPAGTPATQSADAPATARVTPPPAAAKTPAAPVAAQEAEQFVVETSLFRVELSNRGAVAQSWLLKHYRTRNGKPLELVNTAARVDRPFSLYFKERKPSVDLSKALFAAEPDPDGLGITYRYSNGNVTARKTFRFRKDSYLAQVVTEVTEDGKPLPHLIEWRGGFGDLELPNPSSVQHTLYFDAPQGELEKQQAKAAKEGPVSASGSYSFAGIEDTYFAAAFLPEGAGTLEVVTFSDSGPTTFEQEPQEFPGVAVGSGAVNRFAVFVGPKDIDILRAVNPRLESIVDFGWFGFLAKPLFLIVNWVTDEFVHNYGWSIVVVTVVLNFLLFPLKISSMKSMKKMQALQPQIAAINERFKGISIRDPRKSQQNQEVMDLYKRHGVNPMGGCMPMLLQIPFFIAFYNVFTVSVEMRGATWLWVSDLSRPENLPIKILPITMIVSQFVMQKMTPSTSADPTQQRMMLFMPLVFGFMFYNFSSGLVLYYLTSNLVSIGQQWFFNRTSLAAVAAESVQVKKKNGKKK
jgi:YidC/Oxa1 family membrane protein insertase